MPTKLSPSTPGVYVEEIATLPPSVADVATAIPAFLGYTENVPEPNQPIRLTSMVDYDQYFGGPKPTDFTVTIADSGKLEITKTAPDNAGTPPPDFLMYYSLKMYFANGGGPCYVVSAGQYPAATDKAHFTTGLGALKKEDEPTLILLTDAVNLTTGYYDVCNAALDQCAELKDRFAILDVLPGTPASAEGAAKAFRDGGLGDKLQYGAAYYPYLQTMLPYAYDESRVTVIKPWPPNYPIPGGLMVICTDKKEGLTPKLKIETKAAGDPEFTVAQGSLIIKIPAEGKLASEVVKAWKEWRALKKNDPHGFDITQLGEGAATVTPQDEKPLRIPSTFTLKALKDSDTQVYNQVKAALRREWVVMPPSPAIAGIYAAVDRDRGVWKAPANVSVASVLGPTVKITNDDQDRLNVDPTAGKSINAIRSFVGKGTLVWGARTLAGNDNEWRYINVRRLFNMIEESTRKATAFAVFEANDATTWLKVKGMIDSYLYGLWERGALAGPTPDKAYYVHVGLGKTMTTQDILEGRMIVEIGIAAVRPAEFIIIQFSHKLQEA